MKILKTGLKIIIGILLTYAVVFSIAGTILLIWLTVQITTPINQVKYLIINNPRATSYMSAYGKALKAAGDTLPLSQRFVPLDSIPSALINCVIASEDDAFYIHPGFDINAILAAFERNRAQNKIILGGSTITQQLAKNLFLSNERTFDRKYREVLYTLLLEKYLGKKRILELYLNYAQWGKRVFGCESAAQYHFHKPCAKLTFWESTRLAAILAKPEKANPQSEESQFIAKRLQTIADNLLLHGEISESTYTAMTGHEPPVRDTSEQTAIDTVPRNRAKGK